MHFRTLLTASALAALPGADQVQLDQGRASVHTRAPEQLLRAALAADATLNDLEVIRPRLEDAVERWLKEAA